MSLAELLQLLPILGFFAVMVVLQTWVLPKMGVPT